MHTIAMSFALKPLADVRVIVQSSPNAIAMLKTFRPFAIVHFAIHPSVDAFAVSFALIEISKIRIAIWIPFKTLSVTQIVLPATLVLTAVIVFENTFFLPFIINHNAKVNGRRKSPFYKVKLLLQADEINLI